MSNIRKLELSDIEDILLLRLSLQNFDQKYMDPTKICVNEKVLADKTRLYLQENLNKNVYLFGYFVKEELVSMCGFYVFKQFPTYTNPSGLVGHMASVYTKEAYRRNGYQRETFTQALTYAEKMGITKFELDSGNEEAIAMYKTFGFTSSSFYKRIL